MRIEVVGIGHSSTIDPSSPLRPSGGCVRCETEVVDSKDVEEFFERVSVAWDDMRSSFYNADIIDALADRTGITEDSAVLDVGTGTGFVAAGLAGRVACVIGVDNSPAMLAVARQSLDTLGTDNVTLPEGQIDALPLPDNSVDVAVANMVLHHAPDPAAMIAEMARVVRPGGRIGITTRSPTSTSGCAPNKRTCGSASPRSK